MNKVSTIKTLVIIKGSALNRGMNTGIENLVWQLAEQDMEVHILSGGLSPESHDYKLPTTVTYFFTGGNGSPGDHVSVYQELSKKHRYDVVIGWIKNLNPIAALESRCTHTPLFIANEGSLSSKDKRKIAKRCRDVVRAMLKRNKSIAEAWLGDRALAPKMDAVVSISKAVNENVQDVYGLDPAKCHVIYRSIDTELFSSNNSRDYLSLSSPPRLIYSGNIVKEKGLGDVIDALELVEQPVELVLCGVDRGYLDFLKGELYQRSPHHKIEWKGTLSPKALAQELNESDIFVFCSWSEGFGKSLYEAMACGMPVIVSDINVSRELITDHKDGLMVPKKNSTAIAAAINAYLNNGTLRKQCGQNAQLAIGQFSKGNELKAWMGLLSNLISKES